MNKLIIFGKRHDVNTEIELLSERKHGMNITIKYKKDISNHYAGKRDVRHNCTEFHHLFESTVNDRCSAFESDIHGTGGTKDVDLIEWIKVRRAWWKRKSY